jgi:hypothetical protein
MKYCPFLPVLLVSLAACGNPVSPALKWIGTPEDDNLGFSEVFFKITDPNLISSPIYSGTEITVTADKNAYGTGTPYTAPKWYLNGDLCEEPFTGEPYTISPDGWTITIETGQGLPPGTWLEVIVTGSDGKSYTDQETILVP